MNNQSPQAKAIADLAMVAIEACEKLAQQWERNIGKPNPTHMHPFGDVIRGMNSQLKVAHKLAKRAQRMLKPKDELATRGILTICLQACQVAYAFHDEQLSHYIKNFGQPTNAENLYNFAAATKSALDIAQIRLSNFVGNPASDHALFSFGKQIKQRVNDDKRSTGRRKRSNKQISPKASDSPSQCNP